MTKDFIGKAAVAAELKRPQQMLVGLRLEAKRAARAGAAVGSRLAVQARGAALPATVGALPFYAGGSARR